MYAFIPVNSLVIPITTINAFLMIIIIISRHVCVPVGFCFNMLLITTAKKKKVEF